MIGCSVVSVDNGLEVFSKFVGFEVSGWCFVGMDFVDNRWD